MTSQLLFVLFCVIHLIWSLLAIVVITRQQRIPTTATLWCGIVAFMPFLGTLLYIIFSYKVKRMFRNHAGEGDTMVERIVNCNCGTRKKLHNRALSLHNGDNALASLIESLREATTSIHMEYYIFLDDRVGRSISEVLMDKARQGVEVRVIYDAIGSWSFRKRYIRQMRSAGVEVVAFKPLRFPFISFGMNRRNHRKIVVVDSAVAFLGGVNIAKRYVDGDYLGRWRDEHMRVEGDVVADLQKIFIADWNRVSGQKMDVKNYVKSHSIDETLPMQIAWSEQGDTEDVLLDAYTAAIVSAKSVVRISSPYLVPPPQIINVIRVAVKNGVRVVIMTPSGSHLPVVDLIVDSYIEELLNLGVEVYRYTDGFLHAKLLLVDDNLASIGTANIDYRSLHDNMEVVAFVSDRGFVGNIVSIFDLDLLRCSPVGLASWQDRSIYRRLASNIFRLLSPFV